MTALRLADARLKNCCFLLVGYPKDWLAASLAKNPLSNRTILTGAVPYQQLGQWLCLADLAVDPKRASRSGEASGKILHYMALGLPVVCFPSEANRALLGEQCFLATEQTSAALAEAILTGFSTPETGSLFGQNGRETIRNHYSLSAAAKTLVSLYRTVSRPG